MTNTGNGQADFLLWCSMSTFTKKPKTILQDVVLKLTLITVQSQTKTYPWAIHVSSENLSLLDIKNSVKLQNFVAWYMYALSEHKEKYMYLTPSAKFVIRSFSQNQQGSIAINLDYIILFFQLTPIWRCIM